VEDCWLRFKTTLKDLQQRFVLLVKHRKNSKVPWLNYRALKSVKRKHRIYRKYKDSNHSACNQASRKACTDVKRAKYHFEKKLAENTGVLRKTKSFYAYVKGKDYLTFSLFLQGDYIQR